MARLRITFVSPLSRSKRAFAVDVVRGATARSSIVSSLHEQSLLLDVPRACIAASLCFALAGCVTSNVTPTAGVAPLDATDTVHNTDFSPRFPLASEGESQGEGSHAALYLSWLRHGAGTAARSRSGDAVCVAAASCISQGRRRGNEFRQRRCTDGREDLSRRYSASSTSSSILVSRAM